MIALPEGHAYALGPRGDALHIQPHGARTGDAEFALCGMLIVAPLTRITDRDRICPACARALKRSGTPAPAITYMEGEMKPWSEAIEALDELRAFWRGAMGLAYGRGFSESRSQRYGAKALDVTRVENSIMARASLYWIADDMVEVAKVLAATMPDQPYLQTDPPAECGFMVLQRPFVVLDAANKPLNTGAIAWGPITSLDDKHVGREGTWVSYYSDQRVPDNYEVPDAFLRRGPRYMLHHFEILDYGEVPAPESITVADIKAPPEGWQPSADPDEPVRTVRFQRKFPLALWALMHQRIATTDHERPDRAAARRLAKAGKEVETIRVVRLRRAQSEPSGAHRDVDWTHRWIVSGHWAYHWFPKLQTNRWIWKPAHVKGPASAPLVVKKTVHALVR